MNLSHRLNVTSASLSSWSERIVLSILYKMKLGCLRLTLPSGEILTFGQNNGPLLGPNASIQLHSTEAFKRCLFYGDIGFGESYTEGDWDTENITDVIRWMILNYENNPMVTGSKVSSKLLGCLQGVNFFKHLLRDNSPKGSLKNISAHYDLSNGLFAHFLDSSMTYSCADFSTGAVTLEDAQRAKFHRLARSAQIRNNDHVLEIGGGWGAFALFLATEYGCKVTTITVSKEQFNVIQNKITASGLSDRIEARLQDYRAVQGQFDRIVSIEMLEAVGHRHLVEFYRVAERCLKPHGLLGIQVITSADSRYENLRRNVDWIQKHIFPGSLIPSLSALTQAAQSSSKLQMYSLYDMGTDYARTLLEWKSRFNFHLEKIKKLGFDARFLRAWNYYFSYCEAAFAMRHISVVQIVYTRPNNLELY